MGLGSQIPRRSFLGRLGGSAAPLCQGGVWVGIKVLSLADLKWLWIVNKTLPLS